MLIDNLTMLMQCLWQFTVYFGLPHVMINVIMIMLSPYDHFNGSLHVVMITVTSHFVSLIVQIVACSR